MALVVALASFVGPACGRASDETTDSPTNEGETRNVALRQGESLGPVYYTLSFGTAGQGTEALAGTGLENHGAFGDGTNLRLFNGAASQANGVYAIARKNTCCETITQHVPNRVPAAGGTMSGGARFDGTALWLGHSRFQSGHAPPIGSESGAATGVLWNGSTGPANTGADIRGDAARRISVPVVTGTPTRTSLLISAQVYAPSHAGERYGLRPQPYLDRAGFGLTSPGGHGHRVVDLASVVDTWNLLEIRADVITNGGELEDSSDDSGRVTYRYFLNGVETGSAETIELDPTQMHAREGALNFSPGFGLTRGWQGDAAEVFLDDISVSGIGGIRITSPAANATITGRTAFQVDTSAVPNVASIQYLVNGRPLSGPNGPITTAPYAYDWHSGLVHDGPLSLVAVARDAEGNVLTTSAPVPFKVINWSTPSVESKFRTHLRGEAKLVAPTITEGISGKLSWDVEFRREMTQEDIDFDPRTYHNLVYWVDGERIASPLAPVGCAGNATTPGWAVCNAHFELDTTQYANGKHELLVQAVAPVKEQLEGGSFGMGIRPVASLQTPVTFANGRVAMEIRPQWREAFLSKGGSARLDLRAIMTDGSEEPWSGSATFESDHPAIATVSAAGVVQGVATGGTTIRIRAGARTSAVRIFVGNNGIFPHFSSDGKVLNAYTPGSSLWVRDLFALTPDEFASPVQNPNLASQARAAGVNTLEIGFYLNRPDQNDATWRPGFDARWANYEKIAKDNGFKYVLGGDEVARKPVNVLFSIGETKDPDGVASGPGRVRYALEKVKASGIVVSLEMVDEVSFLWGGQPNPQTEHPEAPSDAFVRLMSVMNGATNRPNLTWPIAGGAHHYPSGPSVAHAWMGDPAFADYASMYHTVTLANPSYAHDYSIRESVNAMEAVHSYLLGPLGLRRNAPQLGFASTCSGWFLKPAAGDASEPTEREILLNRNTAEIPGLSVMYAVAAGQAGLRGYHFDSLTWRTARANAPEGIGSYQNGASPPTVQYANGVTSLDPVGTDRWFGIAAAFNLVKQLEGYFLSPQINAIHLGPSIVTGAREGNGGRTLLAINGSEVPSTQRVNLAPYRYPGGASIVRYRLLGGSLRTEVITDRDADTVTFAPGESIVWLMKAPGSSDTVAPAVSLSYPLPNSIITQDTTVKASVSDASGIARVEFYVDSAETPAATLTAAPYSFNWGLSTARPRVWHAITARAYDKAGNMSEARTMVFRP
ncbi:Ig-like domain-containing protein [Pendulispora rubella]|uniref:Ig-like domain-containing protein n=1 Tax=Pendulispora rubella TaxID=2741070 RepID=A0ABZ2KPI9_9BACT